MTPQSMIVFETTSDVSVLTLNFFRLNVNIFMERKHTEVFAYTEEEFVELSLTTPRPCTVWMRGDLDQEKIDEICKKRGLFFVKTDIDGEEGFVCVSNDQIVDLTCSKCNPEDHDANFCRCEDRNIKLAKQLRKEGKGAWQNKG